MERDKKPVIYDVIFAFAVSLAYIFFAGRLFSFLPGMDLFYSLGLFLPVFVYSWFRGFSLNKIYSLHVCSPHALAGSFVLWAGVFLFTLLVAFVMGLLFPEMGRELTGINTLLSSGNIFILILSVGLFPAIGEELLVRGFMLGALSRITTKWPAIVISALLFGLLHVHPARIITTFMIGIVLSYMVWTSRSLFPAMLIHAVHNILLLFVWRSRFVSGITSVPSMGSAGSVFAGILVLCVAFALTVLGIIILGTVNRRNSDDNVFQRSTVND